MDTVAQQSTPEQPAGRPTTLGELRASGYTSRSVKQELRHNLIRKLETDAPLFHGIVGFEETVLPQIENAILSGQDIIFLGERGQAKTRMARLLVDLLDEAVPAIGGCEINDHPYHPICQACRGSSSSRATSPRSPGFRATDATARSSPPRTSPSPT